MNAAAVPTVVLWLGAGFSAPAGLPTQNALLSEVLSLELAEITDPGAPEFAESQRIVSEFLEDLQGPEAPTNCMSLEDTYTFLDQCINEHSSARPRYSLADLYLVRRSLNLAVLYFLNKKQSHCNIEPYKNLTDVLDIHFGHDCWTSVCLNWDSIWDYVLWQKYGSIYYGTEALSLEGLPRVEHTHSTSLYKLHGSINWLACPTCQCIFYSMDYSIGLRELFEPLTCPKCHESFDLSLGDEPLLQSLFITPTFRKSIDNPFLRIVWNKTMHILGKARHLVFLGYSLPTADYHLRVLLRQTVSRDTKISVVLKERQGGKPTPDSPLTRYQQFFSLQGCDVYYGGWESFFSSAHAAVTRE